MLEIYNSISKQKEEFIPIEPGKISLYVCGMTVYDLCHLGHARVLIVFDVVVRYLRASGFEVNYVRNITDIDDKIIDRAQTNNEDLDTLTSRYIEAMHEDCALLAVLPPDREPRATQSMIEIIDMIKTLEQKKYTYTVSNGDVYYSVKKFERYGQLSGRKLDEQIPGKRVAVVEEKKDPADFVLWKTSKPGEPSWQSPWGDGRPGWHIECSAMSTHCLGNHFDIHGGGMDLKFPHHENEIAQTEAATGEKSVNYWMHNGFVRIKKEKLDTEQGSNDTEVGVVEDTDDGYKKMSKSGSFFTVREVLKLYQPEEIRFFILNSHYRSPLNYSHDNLDKAKAALVTLYTALRGVEINTTSESKQDHYEQDFNNAMDDDFNTADAIAVLFNLAREINRYKDEQDDRAVLCALKLKKLGLLLGLLQANPEQYLQGGQIDKDGLTANEIEEFILQRNQARANKDFAEADRIRKLLTEEGIVLEDSAGRTQWRKQ